MQNPINKLLRSFIDFDFGKMFYRPDLPLAYRIANWIVLLFTLAWPILLFMMLFLFDSPANESKAKTLMIIVLFYPIILIAFTYAGFKVFNRNRSLAYAFTLWSYLFVAIVIFMFFRF